jgi:glycosyltransferase involved in cell wall biosynthesis
MGVKHLVLETMALRREVRELRDGAGSAADALEYFGPYRDARPAITVAVTVYDYAEYVGSALRSVGRAAPSDGSVEVVVVDDASRDSSVEQVREALRGMPWLPAVLVRRGTNQGLAAARNAATDLARGEFVQILDADNELYPQALVLLSGALRARPDAAFAYGPLEMFDERGARGLLSWQPWDAGSLRYGNTVDAMAMIRRDALVLAGGYTREPALHGWEDFALWCALADRGLGGVLVPSIVARYRVGLISMISMSNIDATAAWAALTRRHPWLAGAPTHEPLDDA